MKRRIVWINVGLALVLVAAGVGAYFWLFPPEEAVTTGRTVTVQTGTVSETVTATGTVETAGTVELSFAHGRHRRLGPGRGGRHASGPARCLRDSTTPSAQQAVDSAHAAPTCRPWATPTVRALARGRAAGRRRMRRPPPPLNKQEYEQAVRRARTDLADAKASWSDSCLDPAGTCPDAEAWAQLRAAEADVTSAKTAYDQAVQTASATETTNNIKLNQAP